LNYIHEVLAFYPLYVSKMQYLYIYQLNLLVRKGDLMAKNQKMAVRYLDSVPRL